MPNSMFHLQFYTPAYLNSIMLHSNFESLDGWDVYVSGSGVVTLGNESLHIATGYTAGSVAGIYERGKYPLWLPTWAKKRELRCRGWGGFNNDASGYIDLCTGNESTNRRGFGFRLRHNKISGWCQNGGARNYVDLITGLPNNYAFDYYFEAKLIPGSIVEFYIDDILKGSLTTAIPTGTTDAYRMARIVMYNSVTNEHVFETSQIRVFQEI